MVFSSEQGALIRRIAVALDASPHSRAALRMAVRMAMDFEAEVQGVFVEDAEAMRAAQLPFAREVRSFTRSPSELTDRRIRRQIRRQGEAAEALVRQWAERADVPYAFRTVEGDVAAELVAAAGEADLMAMGKTSTRSSRRKLGSTTRAVLQTSPAPVLVLRTPVQPSRPVLAYFDGTPAGEAALTMAARLAMRAGTPLKVLLPAQDGVDPDELRAVVRRRFGGLGRLRTRLLTEPNADRLAAVARDEGSGLVVVPNDAVSRPDDALRRFLATLDRPVVVVRESEGR